MRTLCLLAVAAVAAWGQTEEPAFLVKTGTRVPLALLNSVSTKHAAPGDQVYLESIYPILVGGKIVIPPGSYVSGTVTQAKRPGRVKGKGELFIRFDSMILPNGVTRDFRARVGGIDGRSFEDLDRKEGKITSEGNKSGDARGIGEAAAGGTSIGAIAGMAGGRPGMGIGIGAAAGAAAGLMGVLLSRGPDAVLAKGTQLDMVLDRDLAFTQTEINFVGGLQRISVDSNTGPASQKDRNRENLPLGRRFP